MATLLAPSKAFPQVQAWESQFLSVAPRNTILVLHADSRAGKTTFAESLFDNPLVVTVEDRAFLDLKDFDRAKHDGIVLDNVNSFAQLQRWRAVLQCRNVKTFGGNSPTQRYAYPQHMFLTPVVATVDFDAPDAHLVQARGVTSVTGSVRGPRGARNR